MLFFFSYLAYFLLRLMILSCLYFVGIITHFLQSFWKILITERETGTYKQGSSSYWLTCQKLQQPGLGWSRSGSLRGGRDPHAPAALQGVGLDPRHAKQQHHCARKTLHAPHGTAWRQLHTGFFFQCACILTWSQITVRFQQTSV